MLERVDYGWGERGYALVCNGCGMAVEFPATDYDAARKNARDEGWTQHRERGERIKHSCPDCTRKDDHWGTDIEGADIMEGDDESDEERAERRSRTH